MIQWISAHTNNGWWWRTETGVRFGHVRWPDGQPPTPSGCRWCGDEQHHHGLQYLRGRGNHKYEPPTNAQILARMRTRRAAFKDVCRCLHPWLRVNPWRCEADDCRMHDELLRGWMTPMSGAEATALFKTTTGGTR